MKRFKNSISCALLKLNFNRLRNAPNPIYKRKRVRVFTMFFIIPALVFSVWYIIFRNPPKRAVAETITWATSTPGANGTFTVPATVTSITIYAWGGGGGGGGNDASNGGGGAGGGGGFASTTVTVTPETVITIKVGGGGGGGIGDSDTDLGGGGGGYTSASTTATNYLIAGGGGGGGGGGNSADESGGAGGPGGGATAGDGANGGDDAGYGYGGKGATTTPGVAPGGAGSTGCDGERGETDGRHHGGDGGSSVTSSCNTNGTAAGGINGGGNGGSEVTTGKGGSGGGGGGGWYGGGGGEGSDAEGGGGGGGGSSYISATGGNVAGSGVNPGNNADSLYSTYCSGKGVGGAGAGKGASGTDGTNGCLVIVYTVVGDPSWDTSGTNFWIYATSTLAWSTGSEDLVCSANLNDTDADTQYCVSGSIQNNTQYRVQVLHKNSGGATMNMRGTAEIIGHMNVKGGWLGTSPVLGNAAFFDPGADDGSTTATSIWSMSSFGSNDVFITNLGAGNVVIAGGQTEGFMYMITTGSDVPESDTASYMSLPSFTFSSCGDYIEIDGWLYGTVLVGAQCWTKQNLNVGARINTCSDTPCSGNCGSTCATRGLADNPQGTSCSSIQKYCYNDAESNCDTYGGLYQWDQAMCGAATCNGTGESQPACTTPVQGICPSGWHLPSHYEWVQLERAVCASGSCSTDFPYDITTTEYRGTDEGSRLAGRADLWTNGALDAEPDFGVSGLNVLPGGDRLSGGSFDGISGDADLWSSTEGGTNAWDRYLNYGGASVYRDYYDKAGGFSVRCVRD